MKTSEKIIKYIKEKGQVTGAELSDFLDISDRGVRKQLSSLMEKGLLDKIGRPPKVFYQLKKEEVNNDFKEIDKEFIETINKKYLIITPSGKRMEGMDGFVYWCKKNNLPIKKTVQEYIKTVAKYEDLKKNGLIDGSEKIKNTFDVFNLDKLYYLDFYSIERFGKTRLGQLLLYSKQSQNQKIMKELINYIKPKVKKIIVDFNIDGIIFIPPTVKREIQLMKVLENGLGKDSRIVKITKIKTEIAVPQKTLNKLNDRIENARSTFVVEDNSNYNNILLIDDAVGSGATMNEVAGKIRNKNICKGKIIGLAIAGSFKGFDVISEV